MPVCIFDIDNTLTHGADATNELCCPDKHPKCLLDQDKYQPSWPETGSGTSKSVLRTIHKCKQKGYDIAIATAESGNESLNDKQRDFIQQVVGEDLVDTPMYQNACTAQGVHDIDCSTQNHLCCEHEYKDKTEMYRNIMKHQNIDQDSDDWKKSIVFDDDESNIQTAILMGFQTCQASPQCDGTYCDQGCGIMDYCLRTIQ